jgi:hypothetical protein
MLRPLPRNVDIIYSSLLAHAVLFRGLHERIPTATVNTHAAENICRDRPLSPAVNRNRQRNSNLARGKLLQ